MTDLFPHLPRTTLFIDADNMSESAALAELRGVQRALRTAGMTVLIHDLATDQVRFIGDEQALTLLPPALSVDELLTRLRPRDREDLSSAIQTTRLSDGRQRFLHRRTGDDGQEHWLRCDVQRHDAPDEAGVITGVLQDVTEAHRAELALAESEAKLRAVVDHTADAITIKDRAGRFLLINPTAARALGSTPEALLGRSFTDLLLDPVTQQTLLATDEEIMASGEARTYELTWPLEGRVATVSLHEFPYRHQGEVQGTVCISHDVTTQKALERQLRELAQELEARVEARTAELTALTRQLRHTARHDQLTGLPNRAHFMEQLQTVVEQRLRDPAARFALLFLDFDHFKLINDSLGHVAGDDLLRQIAGRLLAHASAEQQTGGQQTGGQTRSGQTAERQGALPHISVARYGGDEFMVLLRGVEEEAEVTRLCEQLGEHFRQPFTVWGREVQASASIGATGGHRRYTRAEDVLRDADIAMYWAKGHSRGSAALFDPTMRERRVRMLELQSDLGQALRLGQLLVHYQPIMELADGPEAGSAAGELRVKGVEALVRWQHPQHGLIPPADFILLAEERSLICELDLWVLRRACTQMARLPGGPRTLSVNFSARHFERPGLPERVGHILAETGFPPDRLTVEITERLLLSNGDLAARLLRQLQEHGIQIAIDDFGTGYSSLSYIQHFPLNIVKIDRAFTAHVTRDPAIVRSIVQMARSLGLRVVAEGVETAEQQRALQEIGCDCVQGYLYARPLSADALRSWLRERDGLPVD